MRIFFSIACLALFSCSSGDEKNTFAFLEGTWVQNGQEADEKMAERWVRNDGGELNGIGWMIEGNDSTAFEELKIHQKNGKWLYSVHSLKSESHDVDFELITNPDSDSLVFSNPDNFFPAQIIYLNRSPETNSVLLVPSGQPVSEAIRIEFLQVSQIP
jgi:hypothetical protein